MPTMAKPSKRIFATLFFSMFVTVTGVGIVVPLLPVYAHDLGASGFYIALIFGAFSISRTIFIPFFGKLSDKKGRKPFIVMGLFAYAVLSMIFIFATSVESLIALRFIQGIASAMIMPAVQAYIGDITPVMREGTTMGIFNLSLFVGLSIGPCLGGLINDYFGLPVAFASMGIFAFVGFMLSFLFLPPVRFEKSTVHSVPPMEYKKLIKDRGLIGMCYFRFAYTTCIGVIWGFLPVFADTQFSLSSSSIGILIVLGVAVSGTLQTPMGMIADRINRKMMVIAGGLFTGYALLSFESAEGFSDLFLSNIYFGIGGGVAMASLMAMSIQKGNDTQSMGSVMSLLTMAHSMGMLAGALMAGLMLDMLLLRQAFFISGMFMLSGVVVFFFCTFRDPNPGK